MDPREYDALYEIEDLFWWHRALHLRLEQLFIKYGMEPPGRVLDVGCGAGGWLTKLRCRGWSVEGVDLANRAVEYCRLRGNRAELGTAERLRWDAETFEVVTAVNLIENERVDPTLALKEMWRVLKRNGNAVVVVPAYEALRGGHDTAVSTARRFSIKGLMSIGVEAGFQLREIDHFFTFLFPLMAAAKLISRVRHRHSSLGTSDVRMPLTWMNSVWMGICRLELAANRNWLPSLGTTLIAVFAKP